jgi:uncharacterized protein YndB with AHSA1/START domain
MNTPNRSKETANRQAEPGASGGELVITRIFDAPRELVFKTWTDPKQAAHWMGPRGFTAQHVEGELRPGGPWRLCLRPDDGGKDLWQGGVYREVVEPERLVFTFAWDGEGEDGGPGPETLVTLAFAEHEGGKTELTFRQAVFKSTEQLEGHRGGWNSTFDRLGEHLHEIQSNGAEK